ncbi:MAG: hypothetical protein IJ752_06110 [Alphaproteobacteria bacterium]|nr:hypothetical protein [Alphaproteobacteria bacterium]
MRYEPKETADIKTIEDVETRVYHAFKVMRTFPDPGPKGFASALGFWIPEEYPVDEVEPKRMRERFVSRDYRLAEEFAIEWWPKLPLDPDDKRLIAYRCGAPTMIDGKMTHWSGVRKWKDVAYSFHCHRNTAKYKWDMAIKEIFSYVQSLNCA